MSEKIFAGGIRQEVDPIRTYDYEMVFGSIQDKVEYPAYYKIPEDRLGRVKNQGNVGACVACVISSLTEVFDYIERTEDGEQIEPQEFSEGWAYGILRDKRHNQYGMYVSEALDYWRKIGVIPKKYFDILVEMPEMRKKVEAMTEEYFEIAKNYRIKGYVSLCYANPTKRDLAIKEALKKYEYGVLAGSVDYFYEGHCIMLVGWNDENNTYIFKNSWGTDWKDGGFSEIPKNKIDIAYLITDEELTIPFTDVLSTDWFYGDIKNVYLSGLMKGITSKLFAPNQGNSRAEMVTLMSRLIDLFNIRLKSIVNMIQNKFNRGINAEDYFIIADKEKEILFADIPETAWYYEDFKKVYNIDGLIEGITELMFEPEKILTRAEMATFLNRLYRIIDEKVNLVLESQNIKTVRENPINKKYKNFIDVDNNAWYYEEIVNIYERGIMQGIAEDMFAPEKIVTRAEVATIINRTSKYIDQKNKELVDIL